MPPKPKFSEGEKVLCYHGPLLYEAKCVRSRKDAQAKGEFQFFVHYQGWNKNWDEWVPEPRILKINTENLDKKAKLLQSHQASVKEKKKSAKNAKGGPGGGGSTPSSGGTTPGPPGPPSVGSRSNNTSRASTPVSDKMGKSASKRFLADDERSTSSREDDSSFLSLPSSTRRSAAAKKAKEDHETAEDSGTAGNNFNISLPEELKYVLVSDWDLVNHKRQIFQLPAKTPVSAITGEFLKHVEKSGQNRTGIYSEVVQGLKDVFDEMLGLCLLYKIERKQFESLVKGDQSPFDVYGSPHLLRFMVKLGPYLRLTHLNAEADIQMIEGILQEFLNYLETNRPKYFSSKNYIDAPE